MPLDHYVSQVHLKNFYSPALGERMYGIRKSDLHTFQCSAKDVCRIDEGSTNIYIKENRAIEKFLNSIEPKYNKAVQGLREDKIDQECVHTIAGFVAYVASCSPAAMRIQSEPLQKIGKTTAKVLDAQGKFSRAPAELGSKTVTELLEEGVVEIDVDPKYPQALGISTIIERTSRFGNFSWDVMINDQLSSPFFTSDFPIAIEKTRDPRILNRVIPLAPDIAIRIRPNIKVDKAKIDLSFSQFSCQRMRLEYSGVKKINQLIVQCAEKLVFYRDEYPWIQKFVSRNRKYRIEPKTCEFPTLDGVFLLSSQHITRVSEHREK